MQHPAQQLRPRKMARAPVGAARLPFGGVVEVGFEVEGKLAFNGDTEAGQINVAPILDGRDTIEIADDGVFEASFFSVSGFSGLTCKYTAAKVNLAHCTIALGPDAAATGLDFSPADTVSLVDCTIHDASTVTLGDDDEMTGCELHQRAGSTWTAIQIDGDAVLDDILIYTARTANAGNCTLDGFCWGARLNDSGVLYMRQSEILDAGDSGVHLPGKTASVDLGYPLTSPPPPPEGMYGDNCIATEDLGDYRVHNRNNYTALALGQPVPNPFNPSCELKFTLPASGAASTFAIYDLNGRHLATLFSGRADGREHSLRWDGRDERGHSVSSGVYFARLSVGSESQSRKLVVLK